MPRPRQRDITAIVKAAKNAGENVARIEVDNEGKVVVYVGDANKARTNATNSLERLYDEKVAIRSKLRRV